MNKTILCGRLGADPELRGSVLKLRLATSERRKDKDGNWSDHTEWHAVVVFGKRAEALHRLLRKGSRVLVEGKLRTSSWEKDGEKRYKTEFAADEVELLDSRQDREAPRELDTFTVTSDDERYYGWYYEGGSVQDEATDVWTLLERAIPEAIDDGRLHALRVGKMHSCLVSELFDAEDVISMSNEGRLSAETIVEVISERHGDRAWEGLATIDDATAKPALRRIVQAHRCAEDAAFKIVQWADKYVALDPHIVCLGKYPLPIEYVEGEWRFGCDDAEPPEHAAVIVYQTEPSPETGHVGWCWWALGKMGNAKTLREAMAACEAVILDYTEDKKDDE